MPEISRFFGIVIRMFYADHQPAHFHAYYGNHQAKVSIESLTIIDGELPSRAFGLVIEWASIHRNELIECWQKAERLEPLGRISPLE